MAQRGPLTGGERGPDWCYRCSQSRLSRSLADFAKLVEIHSKGVKSPGAIAATLQNTANKIACPTDLSIYAFFPAVDNGAPQVCQGDLDYDSFNGHGQVNALSAITE